MYLFVQHVVFAELLLYIFIRPKRRKLDVKSLQFIIVGQENKTPLPSSFFVCTDLFFELYDIKNGQSTIAYIVTR